MLVRLTNVPERSWYSKAKLHDLFEVHHVSMHGGKRRFHLMPCPHNDEYWSKRNGKPYVNGKSTYFETYTRFWIEPEDFEQHHHHNNESALFLLEED